MGLAPYGKPIYASKIKEKIIDIKDDGSFKLNLNFFKYHRGFRMTSRKFHKLFGEIPRKLNSELTQFHMDLAASIQLVTEEIVLKLSKNIQKETGIKNICLAGGVALNCVANGKLLREKIFDDIWIQPASGDAGSSLGCALLAYYDYFKNSRIIHSPDSMKGTYLGCEYSNEEIINYLDKIKAPYYRLDDKNLFEKIACLLDKGNVIGWFNGPMEFGPRALGGRSIIGDARNHRIQSIMNLKIKYRESFRLLHLQFLKKMYQLSLNFLKKSLHAACSTFKKELCKEMNKDEENLFGIEKLKVIRSSLPSITHVDYSARVRQ